MGEKGFSRKEGFSLLFYLGYIHLGKGASNLYKSQSPDNRFIKVDARKQKIVYKFIFKTQSIF